MSPARSRPIDEELCFLIEVLILDIDGGRPSHYCPHYKINVRLIVRCFFLWTECCTYSVVIMQPSAEIFFRGRFLRFPESSLVLTLDCYHLKVTSFRDLDREAGVDRKSNRYGHRLKAPLRLAYHPLRRSQTRHDIPPFSSASPSSDLGFHDLVPAWSIDHRWPRVLSHHRSALLVLPLQ